MPLKIQTSERLAKLPPYLFAEMDRLKREARAQGRDVIDLGVGDPDLPTPSFIIEELARASRDPKNHRYALDAGMPELRRAIAAWYRKRFGVVLDPEQEVLPLVGSKEGIAHLPLALVNPGDSVLIPDPGYPPYRSGTVFAGGNPVLIPLLAQNDFLPDLGDIEASSLKRAKLMFLNYPNNPTAACAPVPFFEQAVRFAQKNDIIVCHDAAYSEIAFDGYRAPSFLQIAGAKEVGIEVHSLSKTFNMTGWRIGFAVGNTEVLRLLGKVKANIDSGIFQAIQYAGLKALEQGALEVEKNIRVYEERRDLLVSGFRELGWKVAPPKATFYVWVPVPPGYTSQEISVRFLEEADLVVTPGNGFGPNGEGYFRMALTVPKERIAVALERIRKMSGKKVSRK
jgi:LL-diaminopimelate aminotransferase